MSASPSLHAALLEKPRPPSTHPEAIEAGPPARIRIEGLDLLRLVAALGVVLYHYAFRGALADDLTRISIPSLAPVAKYGFLGLDLFFVISGYVIAGSAVGRTWREFSVARFARIYPTFVVCMTATFAAILLLGRPPFATSFTQWVGNLLVASPLVGVPFMDGAYWSIVYEIVFYGWMALLVAAGGFPRRAPLVLVAWLALSMANELAIGSGGLRKLFLTDHSGFFAAGVSLYLLRAHRGGGWLVALSTLVAACQLPMAAEWMREHYRMTLSNAVLVVGALACIGLVAAASRVRTVRMSAGLVAALGGLTYPLYLLHQNVGYVLFNRLEGVFPAPVIVALTAGLMLAAAWAVWRFVEGPCRRAICSWLKSERQQQVQSRRGANSLPSSSR